MRKKQQQDEQRKKDLKLIRQVIDAQLAQAMGGCIACRCVNNC